MANSRVYKSTDAAGIEPKLVPNTNLMARDDSGGPDWDPYTQQFGDGGDSVRGAKPHLSASGGTADKIEGTEVSDDQRTAGYDKAAKLPHYGNNNTSPRAKKEAME